MISRGVQQDPSTDPPAQPGRPVSRIVWPNAGDGRRRFSNPKTRDRQVGWRVKAWKTDFQPTRSKIPPEIAFSADWSSSPVYFVRSVEIRRDLVEIWPYLFEISLDFFEIHRDLSEISLDLFEIGPDLVEICWDLFKIRPNLVEIRQDLFEIRSIKQK